MLVGSMVFLHPDAVHVDRETHVKFVGIISYIFFCHSDNHLNDDIELSPFSVTALARFYGVSTDYLLGMTENTAAIFCGCRDSGEQNGDFFRFDSNAFKMKVTQTPSCMSWV